MKYLVYMGLQKTKKKKKGKGKKKKKIWKGVIFAKGIETTLAYKGGRWISTGRKVYYQGRFVDLVIIEQLTESDIILARSIEKYQTYILMRTFNSIGILVDFPFDLKSGESVRVFNLEWW